MKQEYWNILLGYYITMKDRTNAYIEKKISRDLVRDLWGRRDLNCRKI